LISEYYWKNCREDPRYSDKNNGYFIGTPINIFDFRKMKNVSDKSCREIQNTFYAQIFFSFFENRAVNEIMWKNSAQPGRTQMTI
jgi:hypothetical protein